MAIDLYLMTFSPFCRTVQMVAKHLNIDLNLKHIDFINGEHLSPEFMKLNPAHKIPTINDDGFILWESRAISQYLCNKYAPDSQLYPKEPKSRANVDRMLDFDNGSLLPAIVSGVVFINNKNGTSIESSLFHSLKLGPMRGSDATEEQINTLTNTLQLLDVFIGDCGYVAANHLTIADLSILAMATILISAEYDLSSYANVNRWLNKLQKELPYFDEINRKVIDEFPTLLEQTRNIKMKQKK